MFDASKPLDASKFSPTAQAWLAGYPLDTPELDDLLREIGRRASLGDSPETIATSLSGDALTTCDHYGVGPDDPLRVSFVVFVGDLVRLTTEPS